MKDLIENRLAGLLSKRVRMLKREDGLFSVLFGRDDVAVFFDGQKSFVHEYELVVRGFCRLLGEDGLIVIGKTDMFRPLTECCQMKTGDDRSFDDMQLVDFDWLTQGSSLFDGAVAGINEMFAQRVVLVETVSGSEVGDVSLLFDNGMCFEVFMDVSLCDEVWRLICYQDEAGSGDDKDEHFVVTGGSGEMFGRGGNL